MSFNALSLAWPRVGCGLANTSLFDAENPKATDELSLRQPRSVTDDATAARIQLPANRGEQKNQEL